MAKYASEAPFGMTDSVPLHKDLAFRLKLVNKDIIW